VKVNVEQKRISEGDAGDRNRIGDS
jgi:hypothetical protein